MARITISIGDELKEDIMEIAVEKDRNVSWVVREAVKEYLANHKNEKE